MTRKFYFVTPLAVCFALSACGGGGGGNGLPITSTSGQSGNALSVDGYAATFTEYPLPNGATQPGNMTVGPDGEVWFPVSTGIDRVSATGSITGFVNSDVSNYARFNTGITSQNGKVWFGDGVPNNNNNIASLTLGGVFTDIPFGNSTNAENPGAFTSAGGVVYFGFNGNFFSGIGYVPYGSSTTALLGLSTTTGYPIADLTMASNHEIYAAGFNLALPFIPLADFLFRCPIDGSTCTVYILDSIPEALGVNGIAMGADGNLWLTAIRTNAIIKVSLDGVILASYPLPTPNSAPLEIISAPDGTLWFTENGANKLGRMTTSGTLTEYKIPTPNAAPSGITTCPTQCSDAHGRIWFTEANANKVGKLQY